MSTVNFQRTIRADALAESQCCPVEIDGRSIIVCHTKDGWHALDNVCTHAYAKMSDGRLRGFRLVCPLHGGSFDCRTGAVLGAPAVRPLKTYQVRLVEEHIEVAV